MLCYIPQLLTAQFTSVKKYALDAIKAQYKYVSHLLAFLKDKVVAADRAPETWEEASE